MVRGVCPCSDADVIRKWNVMIRNARHIPCMEHDISDLKDDSIVLQLQENFIKLQ